MVFADKELLKELTIDVAQTIDGSEHGSIEERIYQSVTIPNELKKQHDWPHLNTLVEVISKREIKESTFEETRYYITSLENNAQK